MIPKIIHYCWFGRGEKPKLAKKCIASWKKFCPDYQIIEWNEDNFDIDTNGYTRWCYDNKKYAFLSDYVRLVVVEAQGGVYFDTDVELIRPPDAFLAQEAFFGFETPEYVQSGLGFGSVAHGTAIKEMMAAYDPLLDGLHGVIGCPKLNTQALVKLGLVPNGQLQTVAGAMICPPDHFNPYESATGTLNVTQNTISIHWYAGSWLSPARRLRSQLTKPLHRIFGVDAFKRWRK